MSEPTHTPESRPAGRPLLVDFETGKILGVAPAVDPLPRYGTPDSDGQDRAAAA